MQFVFRDLGHQPRGTTVLYQLSGNAANCWLMTPSEFSTYKRGSSVKVLGGGVNRSPFRIVIPRDGHWIAVVDRGGLPGRGNVAISVQAPPRGIAPTARSAGQQSPYRNGELRQVLREAPPSDVDDDEAFDVFISHASEDKTEVARPLRDHLEDAGLRVWLDESAMRIGSSLRRSIDRGIARSRFAVVVLSPDFIRKGWTQYELDGLVTLSNDGHQSMLPIWHRITRDEIVAYSPSLADRLARDTALISVDEIAAEIIAVVTDTSA